MAVNGSKPSLSHGSMCLLIPGLVCWALGARTAQVVWLVVQTNPSLQWQPAPHQALCVDFTAGFLKTDLCECCHYCGFGSLNLQMLN